MKNYLIILSLLLLVGCGDKKTTSKEDASAKNIDLKTATFDELFKEITPKEIDINEYKILSEDWSIVTAGNEADYNSMIASWGGFGILFEKPTAWLFLNANRYTLQKIKENETYSMSYMDSTYTEQKMILGTKSGRDTDKMKNHGLTPVKTPSGNMAYKEAYMIIELQLEGLTEIKPENLKTEDHRQFLIKGRKDGNGKEYHNMVTGFIKHVWVRK